MTLKLAFLINIITISIVLLLHSHKVVVNSLDSTSSTIAVTYATKTVCGIVAAGTTQRIKCYDNGNIFSVHPNISFQAISGGFNFFCGLTSGGFSIRCWEPSSLQSKRIYHNSTISFTDLTIGYDQVCAREVNSGVAMCWRGGKRNGKSPFPSPATTLKFRKITSGSGFTCGILRNNGRVYCWGNNNGIGDEIQRQFANLTMLNLVAGESHACGFTTTGFLVCKGNNEFGQLNVSFSSAFEFSGVAVGPNFTCAIKQKNGLLICWGAAKKLGLVGTNISENVSFESIVAGLDFLCGLTTRNLSILCWGLGWSSSVNDLPLGMILPGACVQTSCSTCGVYPDSETLCDGTRNICKSCQTELPVAVPLPPYPKMTPPSPTKKLSLALVIVGSVGAFAGICFVMYCFCGFLRNRYLTSVQPSTIDANLDITATTADQNGINPPVRSFSTRRYSSQRLGRQRSGSSSSKHMERTENFSLSELLAATNNFSLENKIGAGSFGIVYKGKLADGREVAIKRGETGMKTKKFQEKENAFDSELALLSRLHHRHLVGLIGFCEENNEMLLVYEYMSNGALHDHLHKRKSSSILSSWKMRIKIALDAARGIEYLHNYAVPPIIHRDIKSSNILIDRNWTARVSDFGLSLMGPESDEEFMSTEAVGTVGYIDPEYYVLNVLTAKSDIYGLGVVLLELLTGKRAVFKNEENDTGPMGVVEYATPLISAGKLQKVLDKRVGLPGTHEAEAVELMAYTALQCVNLEGKERPNIIDIVATLERAMALCEETQASFSAPSD